MFDGTPTSPSASPAAPLSEAQIDELGDELTLLSAHMNAAEQRFLVLLERFERAGGHVGVGLKSCAHWLNWRCGMALGAAREHVRVARALPGLPQINAAFARGELSFSKVRAMTRVATAATEATLLAVAQHGTASHVERVVRGYRRAQAGEERDRAEAQYARRELRCYYAEDGSLVISGRLPPEQGALLLKALDAAGDALREEGLAENVPAEACCEAQDPAGAQRADALMRMAETALSHEPTALAGGERYQVMVHVDADALATDGAGLRSELEDGPGICAQTARRLACDCSRVCVHEDGEGEILSAGRRTRQIPPSIRRALQMRDRGCRFPGCTQRRFVDGHHIVHWADGGETSLGNLVSLCRHHHRAVHEGGFSVMREDARLQFSDPRGRALMPTPVSPQLDALGAVGLVRGHEALGLSIAADTAVPRWRGERLDLGMVLGSLFGGA